MSEESGSGRWRLEQEIWYHAAEGVAKGPIRRQQLLGLLARGELDRDTPVWRPGMDDWTPAGEVESLAEMLPPPPGQRQAQPDSGDSETPPVPPHPPSGGSPPGEGGTRDTGRRSEWLPVMAGVVLVVGAGLAAWVMGGSGGWATGVPAPEDTLSSSRQVEEIDGVRQSHRDALADSLARLSAADSLTALHSSGGLAWTRRTAFSGLRRLPDRTLVTHAELMGRALATAPAELCARVARWEASSEEYWRFVSGLGSRDMAQLLEIYRGGVMAELRDRTPWPVPDREAVAAAFSMLGERLSGSARDSLRQVLAPDSDADPEAACWAERTLYRGVLQLPDPWRAVLARAVVTG